MGPHKPDDYDLHAQSATAYSYSALQEPISSKNALGCWTLYEKPSIQTLQRYHLKPVERDVQHPIPKHFHLSDYYAMFIILIMFIPGLVGYILALVLTFPTLVLAQLYIWTQRKPKERFRRNCYFHLVSLILFLASVPLIALVILYLVILFVVLFPMSLLYSILSCNIWNLRKNIIAIRPHGQLWLWSWNDIVCSVMGAMNRQGFFEFYPLFPTVMFVTPILKYVLTCNPLLYNLEEKYISQWTEPLDLTENEAMSGFLTNICYALHTRKQREAIDEATFSAHYQFPPPWRKDLKVHGLQFTNHCLHFTHTIHNIESKNIRSEFAARGIFTVPLKFWNPFHMVTGHVEVNLRNDSIAFEHPMWCVVGQNYWGNKLYSNVNNLFWNYTHEIHNYLEEV